MYITHLVSHIVNGEHGACDWLESDNSMKIGPSVQSTRGARTCPVDRLKVMSVTLMFQLQMTTRHQRHTKPLTNTQINTCTTYNGARQRQRRLKK